MTKRTFIDQLSCAWQKNNSLLCVGLDPDLRKIPEHLRNSAYSVFEFNKAIIDSTADLVCAFKPQVAYYSACAAEVQLRKTVDYIHETYPEIPVILDAKRGDIGSTAEQYAVEVFERFGVDAVTVNPYLGFDSVEPFLKYDTKGVIVLCRTSNPGARDFQDLEVNGRKLYEVVAERVSNTWNTNGNCLLVVGATYPEELREVRAIVGEMPFLVPGAGAQGGDIAAAITNGQTTSGAGLIVNSSRGITYAGCGADFAAAARKAAIKLRDEINKYRRC